jgi:hypothetical protein
LPKQQRLWYIDAIKSQEESISSLELTATAHDGALEATAMAHDGAALAAHPGCWMNAGEAWE